MHTINKYTSRQREFTFIELKNDFISATFLDYGASILSIFTKDAEGKSESVLLAYDNLGSYIENEMYLNATIGPTSGRIKNSSFSIDDKEYKLDSNANGNVNLHGGSETLAYKFFDYKIKEEKESTKLIFKYRKKERSSFFPGKQTFIITYTLIKDSLLIEFEAKTDEDTIINLTNHAYFNLSGSLKTNILDHELYVNSSKTLSLDEYMVPTKKISSIDTHLDFRKSKAIKENFYQGIYNSKEQGIDNPLLLDEVSFDIPQVILKDKESKRVLKLYTTYPCIVCYTHNFPDYKNLLFGVEHTKHLGICFEAQFEPNGINIEGSNKSILRKDEKYYQKTLLQFSVEE